MTYDEAADALYGVQLEDFVAERTRLARELRAEDRADDAAAVAKLRKPTLAAWALNQLARQHRRDVDLLLDAGHRLREAQAGVLRGGERDAFEQARKTEADALRRLARAAQSLLGGAGSGAVVGQVDRSLRAAAVSDEGRERPARGRFSKPLDPASGFDVVAGLAGGAPRPGRAAPRGGERRRAQEALREARARLRDAEAAARAATQELERLRAGLERAEAEAGSAQARVDAAERAVERAQRDL
jgi:hypothetical protein